MIYEDTQRALNEIKLYISMGKYQQSIAILKDQLSINPNSSIMLYLMAFCLHNVEQNEEAIKYCKSCLENGLIEDCHSLLGDIYKDLSQFEKAEEHYIECLRINPQNASALSSYGMLMLKNGNHKKAFELLKEAKKIAPEDEIVLRDIFMFHIEKGNKKTQLNALQRYLNVANSEFDKLIYIGTYNITNGKHYLARENFRQAFMINPTNKHLLELLDEVNMTCHWFFFPVRLLQKFGSPSFLLLGFAIFIVLGLTPINPKLLNVIGQIYIFFVFYTILSAFIYNKLRERRNKK